jgi:hypothetical protein
MTMSVEQLISKRSDKRLGLDGKLAAYLAAAGAVGSILASEAEAVIVSNSTVQPFGINEEVSIDFNSDGQTDFQIDHDRVNLAGNDLDYLQIDKNDVSSAADPLALDDPFFFATFDPGATLVNDPWQAKYVTSGPGLGHYPSALAEGTPIGPSSNLDFQELDNFDGGAALDSFIRVNRLIDEDAGQIDNAGGQPAYSPLPGTPNFVGLGGQVRYLGVQFELNSTDVNNYGWIGIEITNEADATGNVVGWAYQTNPGQAIAAGVIPEPSSIVMAAIGGVFLVGGLLTRKLFGGRRS